MSKLLPSVLALALVVPLQTVRADDTVRQRNVTIADGTVVVVRYADGEPLPVENETLAIDNVGIGIRKPSSLSAPLTYTWAFGLRLKTDAAVERITVEEVFPTTTPKQYLQVDKPEVQNRSWLQLAGPLDAMPTASPWLYIDENSFFIFKFTVMLAGLAPVVTYQPALIASSTKRGTVSRAMQALRQLQAPPKAASGA